MTGLRPDPPARGQSATEYLVVTAVLVLLLIWPLDDPVMHGRSVAAWLAEACRAAWRDWTFFFLLP